MARRQIHAVKTREEFDLVLLVGAFLIGAGGAIALKLGGAPLLLTAVFPAAVLVGYAIISFLTRRLAIEPETVGDNCYYLGFLFTLVSLATALYQISGADLASGRSANLIPSVISSFGVALTSTIVGVFLRILLMQMRPDIIARDREARRDLAHGVRDFRQALAGVSRDLKSVSVEMAQHAAERESRIMGITDKLSTAATELMDRQAQAFEQQMHDFSKQVLGNLSRHITEETVKAVATLKESADQLAVAVRETAEAHEEKVNVIGEANAAIAKAASDFKTAMSDHHRAALGSYRTLEGRAEKIAAALDAAHEALQSGTSKIDEAMRHQYGALDERTGRVVDRLASVDGALAGVVDRLNQLDLEALAGAAGSVPSNSVSEKPEDLQRGPGIGEPAGVDGDEHYVDPADVREHDAQPVEHTASAQDEAEVLDTDTRRSKDGPSRLKRLFS